MGMLTEIELKTIESGYYDDGYCIELLLNERRELKKQIELLTAVKDAAKIYYDISDENDLNPEFIYIEARNNLKKVLEETK
jgi:hypothetical protein